MIVLEELKTVLEPLIKDAPNAPDIIDAVKGLDKPVEPEKVVDQEAIDAAVAAKDKEWNDRYMKAFFGDKAESISTEIPEVPEATEDTATEDGQVDLENITVDDLFEKKIIE